MNNKKVAINQILNVIDKSFKNKKINKNELKDILSQILLYQNITILNIDNEILISENKLTINELINLFNKLNLIDKSLTFENVEKIAYMVWNFDYNIKKAKIFDKIYNLFN